MKLSIGIVGLPNVGKSTLFNALLKKQVADVANYPFCTIEPNVGIVEVPDGRLPILAKIVKTERIIPAVVEFYDIAGLVKGASQGEGLGNKFLSHIREVAAIAHVVRLFDDSDIIHVNNQVDPKNDIEIINSELILADLETLSKQKEPKLNAKKEELQKWELIKRLKDGLNKGILARELIKTEEEWLLIRDLNLLTIKPVIFVFNVSEKQLINKDKTIEKINSLGVKNWLFLNAKLENEVLELSSSEQKEYLSQYGLEDTGLNRLIKKSYETLGLMSFLTAGTLEVRAWTIKKGTTAVSAAGVIHSEFEKKFIKAEIVKFVDFIETNGWIGAREKGKVLTVGRDYIMEDGDIVDFKIGA